MSQHGRVGESSSVEKASSMVITWAMYDNGRGNEETGSAE